MHLLIAEIAPISEILSASAMAHVTKTEQRSVIRFCAITNKSPTETVSLLNEAYGANALSRSSIFKWHAAFLGGRESVNDRDREGVERCCPHWTEGSHGERL